MVKTKQKFGRNCVAVTVLLCLLLASSCMFSACENGGWEHIESRTEWQEPVYRTRDLRVGLGAPLPHAEDFFDLLPEGFRAEFAEEFSEMRLGEQTVKLRLVPENDSGRSISCSAGMTLVRDTEPPVMRGVRDLSAVMGDSVAYRKGIELTDDCFGEVTLTVDSSAVRQDAEGVYPVVYVATDAAGNRTEQTAYVHVYQATFDEDKLWALIDERIRLLQCASLSREEQCRRIYPYLQQSIAYTGGSDKGDWKREAYRALTAGTGDCFSYFAAAKAFFVRLGIETLDVERSPEVAAAVGERHYWAMVNLSPEGDAATARWYHFDACRLSSAYGYVHSGCLLTDAQLDAYSRVRKNASGQTGYFYAYDRDAYPGTPQEILTPTPELDPYMK